MLEIQDLVVSYGQINAVKGLTMEVREGEVVAVVGPNGAGKSTTLSSIAGLVRPKSGSIRFRDEGIDRLVPEDIVRLGIALVPESRNIFTSLTVGENLQLGTTIRRDRAAAQRDIEAQLERFPILLDRLGQPAGLLSGGEQQQLAIARALVSRPSLLLLDEPSLGLAPKVVDLVFEAIEQLRVDGITTLLVEQNATRAVSMADRAYVLRNGRVALSGTSEELGQGTDLANEYLGIEAEGAA